MSSLSSRNDYLAAVSRARQAAQSYYHSDAVVMDDQEYDTLVREIEQAESEHPDWVSSDSPTQVVGADTGGEVRHAAPMLSLGNVFSNDELAEWMRTACANAGGEVSWVVEPKLDGLAIAITYRDGVAVRAATRGDGETGEDVSHVLPALTGVAPAAGFTGEVRGEVVLTAEQFQRANETRLAHGDKPFANARNGAAGALRGQEREYVIEMSFYAYDLVSADGELFDCHSDMLSQLRQWGFTAAADLIPGPDTDVIRACDALREARGSLGVDTDGAVVKVNEYAARKELGFSSRAPKWAIALKYPADTVLSVLRQVHWQVGRTGVITPRGEIDPVVVGGVTVTYATLHNPDDIARKGFLLGDVVSVYRAGEVVPRIEAPITSKRDGSQSAIVVPQACPACGSGLDKSQVRWRCVRGSACNAQRVLEYACSRDALDIEGLGATHVESVVSAGLAESVADLFDLTAEDLRGLERLGEVSAANIAAQIDRARGADVARVITALGVRGTGRSLSRRLAREFGSLQMFADADADALMRVEGIGSEKAQLIVQEVAGMRDVIDRLVAAGIGAGDGDSGSGSGGAGVFAGLRVCVSGSVPGLTRTQAQELVERLGGRAVGSVSKTTDVLVAGEGAGSKLAKAQDLGVRVMDASEFATLV